MEQRDIDRINELAALAKRRELTREEAQERAELRRAYIDSVKASLEGHLQSAFYVDEKGNKIPLTKRD